MLYGPLCLQKKENGSGDSVLLHMNIIDLAVHLMNSEVLSYRRVSTYFPKPGSSEMTIGVESM